MARTPALPSAVMPSTASTSASPFSYLAASDDVTRYQHPTFRSLEVLLPASLWSDSFLEARARYTLTPPQATQSSVKHSIAEAVHLGRGQHRVAATADAPPSPLGWSFMTVCRRFKRAREKKALALCSVDDEDEPRTLHASPAMCALSMDAVRLPGHAVSADATAQQTHKEQRSSSDSAEAATEDSAHGLSDSWHGESLLLSSSASATSCSSSASEASSTSVAAHSPPSAGSNSSSRSRATSADTRCGGLSAASPAPPRALTPAHRAALSTFARLLTRAEMLHSTLCPLCSPARPPRWGRCAQPTLSRAAKDAMASVSTPNVEGTSSTASRASEDCIRVQPDLDSLSDAALAAHRADLRQRAFHLLCRHSARLQHLRETKPTLFGESVETHPAVQACAQLGGLSLLRAIAASL